MEREAHAKKERDLYAGMIGYASDMKRDLYTRGLFNDQYDFIIEKFEAGLRGGEIDAEIFMRALK